MHTTPPPSETAGRPAEPPAGPPAGQGFFDWLRGLGVTRSSDRWFAGVAAGVAERLRIDPIIVRGVFIVLALLGGPGLLLYLVGWLLLPDASGRIHVEEIFRGRAETGMIVAAVILTSVVIIPGVIGLLSPGGGFPIFSVWSWDVWGRLGIPGWLTATVAWLSWIAILVLAFFWVRSVVLKRGREHRERTWNADDETSAADDAHPDRADRSADREYDRTARDSAESLAARAGESADRVARDAAEWGRRAGAAADKWGREVGEQTEAWSARYAEHHDAHRLGTAHTVITVALALLAGGLAALWTTSVHGPLPIESVAPDALITGLIAALAVLALSLIVAGTRGRYTGWVGFLSFCGVVALLITVVLPWGTRFQPFGNLHISGSETGAVVLAGNTTVDLTGIDSRTDGETGLEVWVLAGRVIVELPESEPVIAHVRMLAGRIDESGRTDLGVSSDAQVMTSGPFISREIRSNVTPENADEASTVTVTLLAGNVEVEGGGDAQGATGSGDASEPDVSTDTDRRAEQRLERQRDELNDELDVIEWKLSEPGLSASERRSLETERGDVEQRLEDLEMEMNR
ncbi:PspC domain-containing protein [Leucobacter sp. USCH14]|uniref:PspC domain-containing protein n=1 Tax=Leucobacter sp. USCH14 TaxID=3024838 RepID=UPI0030A43B7E